MARLIDLVKLEHVPMAKTLGMRMEWGETAGCVTAIMDATPAHHNPLGTVHGGVYCDLADMAMGMAMMSTLGEEEAMTTIELKINYFRPVITGRMTAEARVVHRGKSSGYIECDVRDADGRLAARAASTCVLLTGERAAAIFAKYRL